MLKKIIEIRGVGRYKKSSTTPNPQLAPHTLVFAANGYGKTTLCAILRSLATGDASIIEGRRTLGATGDPGIDFLLPSGNARFKNGAWSQTLPELAIFDGTFISENVHSGDVVDIDNKRNLYRVIIGQNGVGLAEQDQVLATESRAKAGEISTAGKALLLHAPQGMKLDEFLRLSADPDIDKKIADQGKEVEAAKQATQLKAKAGFKEFKLPAIPLELNKVLETTLEGVSADAEKRIAAHLEKHGMSDDGEKWLAVGMAHTKDDNCPFCAQSIKSLPLVDAYKAVFSEEYTRLKDRIATIRKAVETDFGDAVLGAFTLARQQNATAFEYWQQFCALKAEDLSPPQDIEEQARKIRVTLLALLDDKAKAPLEAITPEMLSVVSSALGSLETSLKMANTAVRSANTLVEARKIAAGTADLKAADAALAILNATKKRHDSGVAAACNTYALLEKEKEEIEARKNAVRAKLEDHTLKVVEPYERRINQFLADFNAGFTIAKTKHAYPGGVATSSYQIVINSVAVDLGDGKTSAAQPSFKNTLSAGDRTTLALAFFLANLEEDSDKAKKIVVFDDPFSSQDAFRRRQTVHEIKRVGKDSAQVIVLSHDASFLRQVWDKCPTDKRIAVQILDARALGSQIASCDLEEACKGRVASEIDDLQAYLSTGAGKSRDIIKKMRVVLETHCRAAYSGSFLPDDNLGGIVGKIRNGGAGHPAEALHDELDQINDYTNDHHHGDNPTDGTVDVIDDKELAGFVRRTLRVVNASQA